MNDERLPRDDESLMSRLLAAGDRDEPSQRSVQKTLLAVGVASGISGAAGSASAGTVGAVAVLKWVALGAIAGASVSFAGITIVDHANAPRSAALGPTRAPTVEQATKPSVATAPAAVTASESEQVVEQPPPPVASFAKLPATAPAQPPATPEAADEAPPARDTLAEEALAIERVSSAVRRHDGAAALSALSAYRMQFPRGKMNPEASALEVEALLLSGQRQAARETARRFLSANPTSPSAKRLRSLLGE